jgi:hypothetical protein
MKRNILYINGLNSKEARRPKVLKDSWLSQHCNIINANVDLNIDNNFVAPQLKRIHVPKILGSNKKIYPPQEQNDEFHYIRDIMGKPREKILAGNLPEFL